nr:Chain C, peptide 1097-1105 from insulin receptor substrate 2 (IRS2): RVASPTSGV [synthetic construct]
RVASPTSGV